MGVRFPTRPSGRSEEAKLRVGQMKLIGIGAGGKTRSEGGRSGSGPALSTFLSTPSVDKPEAKKEPDVLGQHFERMAGAFDHISAALGTVRSIESLVADTRRSMENEFAERRKDQADLAALRLIAEQAPLDLASARQGEAAAKSKLSDVTSELESIRIANASLETRAREAENEAEQLKATLVNERKAAAELVQSVEKLGAQALHLEADLSAAEVQIQALELRSRDAETALSATERARGLLEADLISVTRRGEQSADELLRSSRRVVEVETSLGAERAKSAGLESELASSREDAVKLGRQLDQQSEAAASQAQVAASRLETLQARSERQEEQISELARLVDDLTARERAATRDTAEAKLLRERAEERARAAMDKLGETEREAASAFTARQAAVVRADELTRAQQLKLAELERFNERETSLRQGLQHLEQRLASERSAAEGRIGELTAELQRERSDRAVAEGALDALRKDRTATLNRLARYDAGLQESDGDVSAAG